MHAHKDTFFSSLSVLNLMVSYFYDFGSVVTMHLTLSFFGEMISTHRQNSPLCEKPQNNLIEGLLLDKTSLWIWNPASTSMLSIASAFTVGRNRSGTSWPSGWCTTRYPLTFIRFVCFFFLHAHIEPIYLFIYFFLAKLYSNNVRWLVQVPRIYNVYKRADQVQNFQEFLMNVFEPLFEVTQDPSTHLELHAFLQCVIGFDSVDDESLAERRIRKKYPYPREWNTPLNPPYSYYLYDMFVQMTSLS
jgi:AMP deaminase